MIRPLRNLIALAKRLFGPKRREADRLSLMGIYLEQTNRPTGAEVRGSPSQERQDGKYAQNRRRT